MKRILLLNDYSMKGGAESVFSITEELLRQCVDIQIFSATLETGDIVFNKMQGKLLGGIEIISIFSSFNQRQLLSFLIKKNIDLIHLHNFYAGLTPSILSAINIFKKQKPETIVFQTVHDYHLVCPNSSAFNFSKSEICTECFHSRSKTKILLNICDRRGFLYSYAKYFRFFLGTNVLHHRDIVDHFISPSRFLQEILRNEMPDKKVSFLRNPVKYETAVKETGNRKNNICYFGRISQEKNIVVLLKAFDLILKQGGYEDLHLYIIGEGDALDSLVELTSELRITDRVTFSGWKNNKELREITSTCKVSVLPSKWLENAPLNILESILLGMIPIAAKIGGMEEMIVDLNFGYLFKDSDSRMLADAIVQAINTYDTKIGELFHCQERILLENGNAMYVKNLLSLYNGERE